MAFREVRVFEVREVLRLFLRGEGVRSIERLVGIDRKTVRRYLAAAGELGLMQGNGEELLTDEVKVHELLARRGVVVPQRTLHRYALEVCDVGRGRRGSTVRVDDGKPGDELQVDLGRLGLLFDAVTQRQRVCQGLNLHPGGVALRVRVVDVRSDGW